MYHGKFLVLYNINTLKCSAKTTKYFRGELYGKIIE